MSIALSHAMVNDARQKDGRQERDGWGMNERELCMHLGFFFYFKQSWEEKYKDDDFKHCKDTASIKSRPEMSIFNLMCQSFIQSMNVCGL